MIQRYLLIGVVCVAGVLIAAALITANTSYIEQPKTSTISDNPAGYRATLPNNSNLGAAARRSNAAKAVLDVQGMSCSGCIYQIKSGLADIDGISDVLVDVNSGRVEVYYDSTRVKDVQKVVSAITAVGYPATLKETMSAAEIENETNLFASRSKLYIAAVGDWEIARDDFDAELKHARNRYENAYGKNVFAGEQGNELLLRLQSQIATSLISEGIQMQEIRKADYHLPAATVASEFDAFLAKKDMTRQEFKKIIADSGYDYDYFYKKFENRLTIDHYLDDKVLTGLSNDLDKRQQYSDWYNNARLLAKVVYYDKNLEKIVKNNSAGGGCGNSCSAKKQ